MRSLSFATFVWTVIVVGSAWAQQPNAAKPVVGGPDQAALEKKFEETMSNAVMVGGFTVTGGDKERELKQERYTLGKVTKLKDDTWLFPVRIQYGDKDATLPLPLTVRWAGDTPMITLTNVGVPGFGTFTSRVLIYDDHYAGYWSAGDHGGHLIGRIERAKAEGDKPAPTPEKKP